MILTWELRYCQESGVTKKREEGFLEVVPPRRGANDIPWGKKGFPWGPGVGENFTD